MENYRRVVRVVGQNKNVAELCLVPDRLSSCEMSWEINSARDEVATRQCLNLSIDITSDSVQAHLRPLQVPLTAEAQVWEAIFRRNDDQRTQRLNDKRTTYPARQQGWNFL